MSSSYLSPLGSTSPANPVPSARAVEIYEVTLRDGEQQAGVAFSIEQKVDLFGRMDRMGVPLIETGMIVVSPDESEVVRRVQRLPHSAKVYVLSRAMRSDIDLAADAGADGATIEIIANPDISSQILRWPDGAATEKARDAVGYAHERGLEVNLFFVDATRVEPAALAEFAHDIVDGDPPARLTIADTFGVCSPAGVVAYVEALLPLGVPLHVHCQNEYGLAVANSLAALEAGATGAHVAVNGLGERAGNAAHEEVVLACAGPYRFDTGIDEKALRELSAIVSEYAGFDVAANKPVVGPRLFTIESGIAATFYEVLQNGELGHFYAYRPDSVRAEVEVELGKGSGLASLRLKLDELGIDATALDLAGILESVKTRGTSLQRSLTDAEFLELVPERSS